MAVSLKKGQRISLAKVAEETGVKLGNTLQVGLGWDVNKFDGAAYDLDASAFMLGANGRVIDERYFVFYNTELHNPQHPDWRCSPDFSVNHTGDNKTGLGDGDDETIVIDLSKIDEKVDKIVFAVTIFDAEDRGQNFSMVENSYIRFVDCDSQVELSRYDLGEDFSLETAVVFLELYRKNNEWNFKAVGQGFNNGLAGLCNAYGVPLE